MLPEWVETLLTSCPRHLRKMGYLRELFNIRRCARAWGDIWEPHFEKTRAVIRAGIARCRDHRKAVVLGSGWLNDVPLDELAAAFREVVLVDAVHPFSVRRRLRRYPNVCLVSTDISGVVERVFHDTHRPGQLPRHASQLFCDDPQVDFVASVNLLSQIPYWPVQLLFGAGVHSPEEIVAFGADVVRSHLDYLRRLPAVVALIADVEELTVNVAGRVVRQVSTVYGVDLPWQGEQWNWVLVPRKREHPHHGLHRTVVGVVDEKVK